MSKGRRQQQSEGPEERQHDPITVPEVVGLANGESSDIEIRGTIPPYPTDQTEVKTMVERAVTRAAEQRIFRCVYDEQALARMVEGGARDPDVFCPVCGNRMVRER